MKVKDLIEELKKLDGEKTVGYANQSSREDTGLRIYDNKVGKMNFINPDCRQAKKFDYTIC